MNKQFIAIVIIIALVIAGYYFYVKGSTKNGRSSDLEKEDNRFTKELWEEFTRRSGDNPTWLLDAAIKEYETDGPKMTMETRRFKGLPLKAGALIAHIGESYEGYNHSKLSKADWAYLWQKYHDWKNTLALNF